MKRNSQLVGQNLTFDLEWLLNYGVYPSGILMDTMLGYHLLYPEYPKGLDTIVSIYTDAAYYKNDGKTWGYKQPDQKLWYYNCQDCFYTLEASTGIINDLKAQGLWYIYKDFINKQIPMALEMQRNRIHLDMGRQDNLKDQVDDLASTTHDYLTLIVGHDVNVNSPKQIKTLLYEEKKLTPSYYKGKIVTDENALKKLATKYPECQELGLIITERHLRKKLSSYLSVQTDPDGYVPCSWNIAGTETGRWSSGKSAHRRGLNLQTVPKVLRYAYDSGERVFIQPDLSQAEARVVAYLARCSGLIELFNDPTRSVHMENAQSIFNATVKKDSLEYVLAKQCLHAANYKMGAERFSVETKITRQRAQEILDAYYNKYPEIPMWHSQVRDTIFKIGKLITPLGRERVFYHARAELVFTGTIGGETWRNAIAYIPQATIPDLLNKGMLATWQGLEYAWLHHQGHDSCLISVPCDKLGEAAQRLKQELAIPLHFGSVSLTIPVEVSWGLLWHPMLPWKGESTMGPLERKAYFTWAESQMETSKIERDLVGIV